MPDTITLAPEVILQERINFRSNLLANINYFGTFPGLGIVVKPITFNTNFEQLTCLGLNPGTGFFAEGTLEAVVNINQQSGYETGPCGVGSTEWVRFYVQHGAIWTDVGVTGVTVFNLAGSKFPVSYAVSIPLDEVKKFCSVENVVNVRAILSWEFQPPANTPNFTPVWGNVVDARVQVAPELFHSVPISVLVDQGLVKIDPTLATSINLTQTLPAQTVQPLAYTDLQALYKGTTVPSHRYGFTAVKQLQQAPLSTLATLATAPKALKVSSSFLPSADIAGIIAALGKLNGDSTFEQLTCAGYNPKSRLLEAVIQIKLNSGYSGSLCTAGSTEYVSFYAFFNGIWNALGTASVNVHDLKAVAAGNPVNYAVARVSDVTQELCEKLTAIPLRAILSWQTAPTGPDFVPTWGNILNTQIQPQMSDGIEGEHATIMRIGEVGIVGIQVNTTNLPGDYLANPTNVAGDCNNADDSPFAGTIDIEAEFVPKPTGAFNTVTGKVLPGAHPVIYQALITPPGSPQYQLTNSFGIGVFPINAPILNPEVVITQEVVVPYGPVNGGALTAKYYTYYESGEGQAVNPRVVASFLAGGLDEGNYTITINGFVWDGAMYQPLASLSQEFYVYNGYQPGGGAPLNTLDLTSAADCGNITVGDVITGSYSVTDKFFGLVTIDMTPVSINNNPVAMPTVYLSNFNNGPDSVIYDKTNTAGTSGTFTIYTGNYDPNKDTLNNKQPNQTALPACGYTIQLRAWDRALVSTTCNHHESDEAVGFCLVAAKPKPPA